MLAHLLLISGSLRRGSSNTAALQTVQALAPAGVTTDLYDGLTTLPAFNPDEDEEGQSLPPIVCDLRSRIDRADGLLVSTPEYAGALPGSFKNLLDWTIGGGNLYGKPIAWLNVAGEASPSGAADAHASLRKVLGYAGAVVVEEACARIPLARQNVGEGEPLEDAILKAAFEAPLEAFLNYLKGQTDQP